ncbi:MAG TPA: hypothetical protein DCZ08_01995 [Anaerolineaceae bacterium]|nr:hypothetical protein [Anaerolineaceae bacterium]
MDRLDVLVVSHKTAASSTADVSKVIFFIKSSGHPAERSAPMQTIRDLEHYSNKVRANLY